MDKPSPTDFNGYSVKEILHDFILPEIREGNQKFEDFLEKDYKPFKESTNRWRYILTGGFLILSFILTALGVLTSVFHEVHLL
jgi:hypothetical protein